MNARCQDAELSPIAGLGQGDVVHMGLDIGVFHVFPIGLV